MTEDQPRSDDADEVRPRTVAPSAESSKEAGSQQGASQSPTNGALSEVMLDAMTDDPTLRLQAVPDPKQTVESIAKSAPRRERTEAGRPTPLPISFRAVKQALQREALGLPPESESTSELDQPTLDLVKLLRARLRGSQRVSPESSLSSSSTYYRRIPVVLAEICKRHKLALTGWRIELRVSGMVVPLGFELLGDAVIGRSSLGSSTPDIDFAAFRGREKAVSRRHALLRPTRNHVYLLDLESTNGTQINSIPVGPGVAVALDRDNLITLGALSFTLKIVSGPAS